MSLKTVEVSATLAVNDCEREPIHIPGAVQPHGVLIVFSEPELVVIQFSENAPEKLSWSRDDLLGAPLSKLFDRREVEALQANVLKSRLDAPSHLSTPLSSCIDKAPEEAGHNGNHRDDMHAPQKGRWTAAVHRWDGVLLMELTPANLESQSAASLQTAVRKTIADLDFCNTLFGFCQSAADHFREVIGFERVLIYRFLEDHSGVVVAEARDQELESFLGLRYPASDIPIQARQLYLLSPYRLTADVNAQPVALYPALNPKTGKPLDMSYCALRATSPFHLEYLRNMGVTASLSFSIVREGKLWGLVACHDRAPKVLSEDARGAGEILARILGLQVGIKEEAEHKNYVDSLQQTSADLAERLRASGDFASALLSGNPNLLTTIDASGAALCTGSKTFCLGSTPESTQIEEFRTWLQGQPWQPVWSMDNLSERYGPSSEWKSVASGVMVLQLAPGSPEMVFWFRPELLEMVKWAGNPSEAVPDMTSPRPLGPKRSFQLWQEQVRGRSAPWQGAEHAHASRIRDEMSQALLQHRALEISRLNVELTRSNRELEHFSAVASHDLQEPLRTITAHTELLFRRAGLIGVPDAEQLVGFVRSATERMSKLVSSLLEYAHTGEKTVRYVAFPVDDAIRVAIDNLQARIVESGATIQFGEMPEILADRQQIVQLFQNLLSNALKYRRADVSPSIDIQVEDRGICWLFSIADNGIGFDPALGENIFEPFHRLHGRELSGSGLGLAICRRIVENSGGQIWAEGRPGMGATFHFTLRSAGRIHSARAGG